MTFESTSPRPLAALRRLIVSSLFCIVTSAVATAAEPLVISASSTPVNLPIFVADAEGYFSAEGVAVKINEITSSVQGMEQLFAGKTDLTAGSETLVMFYSFKRDDFAVLTTFVTSTEDQKLVVHGASGITSVKNLTNKRVGTIMGSASHFYLDTLALLNNVEPKSMTVVGYKADTIVAALQKHEVDAIAMWQPQAYRAEKEVPGARTLPDGGFHTLSFNLVSTRKLIDTRSDDLRNVLRALDRATRLIAADPEKAVKILRSRLNVDQAYAQWLLSRYRYQLTLDQSLLTSLESEARWAREEGHVKAARSPNYLRFVYSPLLRQVRPSAVGISE